MQIDFIIHDDEREYAAGTVALTEDQTARLNKIIAQVGTQQTPARIAAIAEAGMLLLREKL